MRTALYYLILVVGLLVVFFFIAYLVNGITSTIYNANIANIIDKSIISSVEQESSSLYVITLGKPTAVSCIERDKILKIGKVTIELQYLERLFDIDIKLYCPTYLQSRYIICSSKINVLVLCLSPRHFVIYFSCT